MSHSYPSDISRKQFEKIRPFLESARKKTKPRIIDLYDVFLCCPLRFEKRMSMANAANRLPKMADLL